MNIEELEQIKQDLKAVYNVMYNFDDMLCDDMQERVNRIEKVVTAYEKEKEKNKKVLDFINDKNNYFEDGENWQNILKIEEILEE